MTPTKISIGKSIETYPGQWIKVGMEADLSPGEDAISGLSELKMLVDSFLKLEDKTVIQQISTQQPKTKEDQIAKIISDISTCDDAKVLESYKLLAKNHPEIQQAYDNRSKELQ